MTLTTETLNDFIAGQGFGVAPSAVEVMARELLANREAQPVERVTADNMQAICMEANKHVGKYSSMAHEVNKLLNRRPIPAPPAPAVPDDYQHLKNVRELYHKQEDRLFSLAKRIKGASFDKYSHVPSQAIDVLEREIFGDDGDACRAAMLAAAPEGDK